MIQKTKIKVKDLQFPNFFVLNEVNLDDDEVISMLNTDIEVRDIGEADSVTVLDNTLVISNPSSITRFLFQSLYTLLEDHISVNIQKDKAALSLLFVCRDYVYSDFDPSSISGPPIIMNYSKLPVPFFIIKELIEPLIGRTINMPILFTPCDFTDSCRVIESQQELSDQYNVPHSAIGYHDFPLILANCNINNTASVLCHITTTILQRSLGDKYHRVIKNILIDKSNNIMSHLIQILKTLRGEPDFVVKFLDYFTANIHMTREDRSTSQQIQSEKILSDNYLNKHIKIAGENTTPSVFRQWSQWSMINGLIEKQLSPMRGSMWPATETMSPHENHFKKMLIKEKKKKKNHLNFEEMLEVYRDLYNHKAIEPGQLVETLLKDNRVWKA